METVLHIECAVALGMYHTMFKMWLDVFAIWGIWVDLCAACVWALGGFVCVCWLLAKSTVGCTICVTPETKVDKWDPWALRSAGPICKPLELD